MLFQQAFGGKLTRLTNPRNCRLPCDWAPSAYTVFISQSETMLGSHRGVCLQPSMTTNSIATRTTISRPLQSRRIVRVDNRFGGGGVIDRPADSGVDVSKRAGWDSDRDSNLATLPPRTDTGRDGGSTDKQRGSPPGGGNHRLLLLNNPQHKEPLVVKSLTVVVPNCDEQHARNCFATSQQLGMAIVTSCLKEHAEFYMQQLYRYGIRTAIEPDTTTA